jgi:hypothetical protein
MGVFEFIGGWSIRVVGTLRSATLSPVNFERAHHEAAA